MFSDTNAANGTFWLTHSEIFTVLTLIVTIPARNIPLHGSLLRHFHYKHFPGYCLELGGAQWEHRLSTGRPKLQSLHQKTKMGKSSLTFISPTFGLWGNKLSAIQKLIRAPRAAGQEICLQYFISQEGTNHKNRYFICSYKKVKALI